MKVGFIPALLSVRLAGIDVLYSKAIKQMEPISHSKSEPGMEPRSVMEITAPEK